MQIHNFFKGLYRSAGVTLSGDAESKSSFSRMFGDDGESLVLNTELVVVV